MSKVLLSLGSNIGDKKEYINKAIELISKLEGFDISKVSSFYKTDPFGYEHQDFFLNICISGFTEIYPIKLLKKLKNIEKTLGRKDRVRWREREIDIDIILFGNLVIKEDNIEIPHPEMNKRAFVLIPASEIESEMKHPILNKSIKELSIPFRNQNGIKKI